ncbi:DNA polymerase lambda [Tolypocladium ophioglossoides CBS 100239]|uniref:DNA polymerase lambda n=1 Tax=Tolypocladium ophioglossoides (strain CBS 100239) TaxID=1163406 RepID=A0A0L0N6S4_TOLOC|nr:DNA polymerase lambda [Tolypocladium ophioglossoides CBS 100239]
MDPSQTTLERKAAYFGLLRRLDRCAADDDDELDAREQRDRQRRFRFFRPPPAPPTSSGAARQGAPPVGQTRDVTPRRVLSAPTHREQPSAQVIKATQSGTKGRLGALLTTESEAMDETVIPDSTRPAPKMLRRSDSTPLPPPRRLLSGASEQSPSLNLGAKKRKRDSGPKLRPEEEHIFKDLAFFYIPDNDIAPARRLRINKAREYGATWTRDVLTATHIVAERNLDYKDVEKATSKASLNRRLPKVVNEDYPIDCIQFRSLLDHSQKKYQIAGQPAVTEQETNAEAPPSSEESTKSLQLKPKPKHNNPRRWEYVPRELGTPLRSGDSSQRSVVGATPAPMDSQPITLGLGQDATAAPGPSTKIKDQIERRVDGAKDELSEYISMMQEFKGLPLDNEDDDDTSSVTGQSMAESELLDEIQYSEEEHTRDHKAKRYRLRSGRKETKFEDRFACNQAGENDANAKNPNARTIEVLQSMANYYDRVNDHWRTMGYRKAITTLKRQEAKICTEEEAFRLPHIGRRIAQKIEEIVTTNKLQRLEYAEDEPADAILQLFLQIYGVGNKQAEQWIARGYRTLDDLAQKAKLTPSQTVGIEHYDDLNTRIPRREVEALGAVVRKAAARIDPAVELIVGGSYRRGADSSHDIDFIVTKCGTESTADLRQFMDKLVRQLESDKFLVARLASSRPGSDGSKWHGCCVLPRIKGFNDDESYRATWRRIDFLLVPETEMGAAPIYFTGNDIFNRSMRLLASKKGMRLNQRGLYRDALRGPQRNKVSEGELAEGRDERRIFEILGVKWREPHERWC